MSNMLNGEEVLYSIRSYKSVKTSTIALNFITNLVTLGLAGMVANDFKLILTTENLYIEALTQATWGGLSETLYTDKICRADIKSFEVENQNSQELIKITTADEKKIIFIRDNEKGDNLALQMSKLVLENVENSN